MSYASEALEYYSLDKPLETITTSETGGKKGVKPNQLHAIPWEALSAIGQAYAMGAEKYGDYNFRKGYEYSKSFDALQRHVWAWWNREDTDPESGLSHLAHAAWHVINLLFYTITGRGSDDRPPH